MLLPPTRCLRPSEVVFALLCDSAAFCVIFLCFFLSKRDLVIPSEARNLLFFLLARVPHTPDLRVVFVTTCRQSSSCDSRSFRFRIRCTHRTGVPTNPNASRN